MSPDWQDVRLLEIADFQNGYAFSSREYVPKSPESKEVLRMGYIQRGGGFKEDDKPVYAPLSSKGSDTRYCLEEGDIVIAMTDMKDRVAILANCAQIPSSGRFLLNQRVGRIRTKDRELVDQKYLYYFMNSPPQVQYLRSMANRGVQVNLTTSAIVESLVSLPSVLEQKAIAHILGTLDDKVELNRKTNETLEGIAKALFKSWFVDFDPVRAKAEGRPIGLPDEVSKLFPDSFEESELGEIPSGWSYKKISEWGSTICGKTPPTKDESLYGGNNLFVTIPDLHEGPFISHASKTLSNAGAESQLKKRLPAGSVMVSCIATPGLVGIAQVECFTNQQINSIIPFEEGNENFLLFSIIESKDLLLSLGGGGSVFFNLSKGRFDDMEILSPSKPCVAAFGERVAPLIAKCFALKEESRTLSTLRDALLPRLVSGDLRVPDAEKMLEEAGV